MNIVIFLTQLLIIGITTLIMHRLGQAALIAFICVQAILANLFVLKQIELFTLNATASDAYMIGCVLTLNLLQEYHGKEAARKTIWISFVALLFYTLMSQLHILYIPHGADSTHVHYEALLSYMPRLATASLVVYLLVQYFDTFFYALMRRLWASKYMTLRNIISVTASQLLDTILFSFLGLYGIMDNIMQIMTVSFIIKMAAMLLLVPTIIALTKTNAYRK